MDNFLFFALIIGSILFFIDIISGAKVSTKKVFWIYEGIFLLFTFIFDNILNIAGVFRFHFIAHTLNIRIPYMPIEDLLYGFCLAYLPAILYETDYHVSIKNLKRYFIISRPTLWPNTFVPGIWALLIYHTILTPSIIILLGYTIIPYNFCVYGINDYFDKESDAVNTRKGKLDGAKVDQSFTQMILFFLGSHIPFLLYFLFFSSKLIPIFLALIFFAITYSAKPFRIKEIPFLDSINSSFHFVLPLLAMLFAIGIRNLPFEVLFSFFMWGMASQSMGAIQDISSDRQAGMKSVATVMGARITAYYATICYSIAIIFLILSRSALTMLLGIVLIAYPINVARLSFNSDEKKARNVWMIFLRLNYIFGFFITQFLLLPYYLSIIHP